jgi:hypothetical protein
MDLPQILDSAFGTAVARLPEADIDRGALASLLELNSACLALLARQALVPHANASPLLDEFPDLWSNLDLQARQRAAACPYLLLDIGFADATRWSGDPATLVNAPRGFFTIPEASAVARQVFIYAWHLLQQSPNPAATLFLGIPEHCGDLIASHTLPQIHELAERHPEWLRPRWPALLSFWRDLLLAARTEDDDALLRARMRGLRLLAADLQPDLMPKYGVALRRRADNQDLNKARSIPGTGQVEDEVLGRHGRTPPRRLFYDGD